MTRKNERRCVELTWDVGWWGYQDLNLGPLPYQGVGVPARTAIFAVVSWAYGRTARFSYLAVSCAYTRGPWRSRAVVGPALGPGARSLAVMAPSVRIARPGDGAGIARVWLDASAYYAELDPGHFKVPDAHGLAELTDDQLGVSDERALSLVAEVDGRLVGWLSARLELPHQNADRQFVREHDWTRLLVDALIVERQQWRRGIGTMLLEAAESWGRAHDAQVVRLDTYAQGPVSVPFYEQHMGYQRRSIAFQKQL